MKSAGFMAGGKIMRMSSLGSALRNVVMGLVFMGLAGCAGSKAAAPPTADEVQATLVKYYTEQYTSEHEKAIWGAQAARVSVSDVKVGDAYRKQVLSGAAAQNTYPVKARVGSDVQYRSGPKHYDFG